MSANKSYADKLVTGARLSYFWGKLKAILLKKADSATTLEGYGIEDAYTKTQVDKLVKNMEAPDMEGYVKTADFDKTVGDISTALDELHTYAQVLVSGGES